MTRTYFERFTNPTEHRSNPASPPFGFRPTNSALATRNKIGVTSPHPNFSKEAPKTMLALNRLQTRPTAALSAASSGATASRTRGRRFVAGLALLTVCLIAANPLPSTASQRTPETNTIKTTTKLKASTTKMVVGEHVTLTATVSSPKATGKMLFYIQDGPGKPPSYFGELGVHAGVAKGTTRANGTGTFIFTAIYQGKKPYGSSISNSVTIVVRKK
jgi:hypothetical protein